MNNEEKKETIADIAEEKCQGTATEPEASSRKAIPVTIMDVELEQLKQEASESRDKYLRLLAESENVRKRMQKERQELIQYAMQNLIVDFLGPIDQMENALNFAQKMSDEIKTWAIGFQMVLNQFKDVLVTNGVTAFDSKGKEFDPHIHEAIETVATVEYPEGTVVEESVRGYKMGDKTIRPARVKVAKKQSSEEKKEEQTKKE